MKTRNKLCIMAYIGPQFTREKIAKNQNHGEKNIVEFSNMYIYMYKLDDEYVCIYVCNVCKPAWATSSIPCESLHHELCVQLKPRVSGVILMFFKRFLMRL